MSKKIIEYDKIVFSYDKKISEVLDHFSLSIDKGEISAILGPNGTGKTTLLLLTLGWLKPDSGHIMLEDKLLQNFSRSETGKKIGLVPQFEPAFFDFSLLEFALMGRSPYLGSFRMPDEKDYEIAVQALEKVGIADKADRSVMNISGGERQLVLLARALAQQTDILLLDEPTTHLDIKNKARLVKIIRELAKEGKTIVFTTHEPEIAAMIADNVVLVKDGKPVVSGKTIEVMTGKNLSHIYDTPIRDCLAMGQKVFIWGEV
jgi:iron complex transport system ATP-binding protein